MLSFYLFLENISTGYQLFQDFFHTHDLNTLAILVDWLEDYEEVPQTVQYLREKLAGKSNNFHNASDELKKRYGIEGVWTRQRDHVAEIDFIEYTIVFMGNNFYFKKGKYPKYRYTSIPEEYFKDQIPLFTFWAASFIDIYNDFTASKLTNSIITLFTSINRENPENILHFLQEIEEFIKKFEINRKNDISDACYYLHRICDEHNNARVTNKVREILLLLDK